LRGVCRNASDPALCRNMSAPVVMGPVELASGRAPQLRTASCGLSSSSQTAEAAKAPSFSARPSNSEKAVSLQQQENEDSPESHGFEGFQGHWKHQACPDIREVIRGDTIHGPDGTITQMRQNGLFGIKIELNGNMHMAKLVGGQLLWDDGDVWIPEEAPSQFDGRWVHNGNAGIVEVINSDIITGPDGTLTPMTIRAPDAFCIRLADQVHEARLVGDRLVWDDGDIWVRGGSFDGRYVHKANPSVKEVIKNSVIHGPAGNAIRIDPASEDSFSICLNGATHQAQLVTNNEIRWDDGDVWILQPEATSSELGDLDDQAMWITEVRKVSISREESIAEAAAARVKLDLEARERSEPQAVTQRGNSADLTQPRQASAPTSEGPTAAPPLQEDASPPAPMERLASIDERVMEEHETFTPTPTNVEDGCLEQTSAGEGKPASGEDVGRPADDMLVTMATNTELSTTAGSFDKEPTVSDVASATVPSTELQAQQQQQQQKQEQLPEQKQHQQHIQSSSVDVKDQHEVEAAPEQPAVMPTQAMQEQEQNQQRSTAVQDQSEIVATPEEQAVVPAAAPRLPTAAVPKQEILSQQPPRHGDASRRSASARTSKSREIHGGGASDGRGGARQRATSAHPARHRGAGTGVSATLAATER